MAAQQSNTRTKIIYISADMKAENNKNYPDSQEIEYRFSNSRVFKRGAKRGSYIN